MQVRLGVGVVILSLYLTLNFVISSLIVGTFKNTFMTLLDIHNGAFTVKSEMKRQCIQTEHR